MDDNEAGDDEENLHADAPVPEKRFKQARLEEGFAGVGEMAEDHEQTGNGSKALDAFDFAPGLLAVGRLHVWRNRREDGCFNCHSH